MTVQIDDELVLDGTRLNIRGALRNIRLAAIVDTPERAKRLSAGWRRYVVNWRVSEGELWLGAIDGGWALEGDPVLARWVTAYVRVSAGLPSWYARTGLASQFAGVTQLDIREGRVHRRRRFTTPAVGHGAPWLRDPATALRFACPFDVSLDPPPRSPALARARHAAARGLSRGASRPRASCRRERRAARHVPQTRESHR